MRRKPIAVLFLATAFALPSSQGHSQSLTVEARDNVFVPAELTVSTGDAVTFKNTGKTPHNVAARDGSFKIALLSPGQSGTITAEKEGTFEYVCEFHPPDMKGVLVVQGAGAAGAPAVATSPSPRATEEPAASPSPVPASASTEAALPVPPTEKYFAKGSVALFVLLLLLVGVNWLRWTFRTVGARKQ